MEFNISHERVGVNLGPWYLTAYFNPRVWGFDFHREAMCCKWWLVIGPFELNRIWLDTDVYPFHTDDTDDTDDIKEPKL